MEHGHQLVSEGFFHCPKLVIYSVHLLMLAEDSLILPGWCLFWDSDRPSRVLRVDGWGGGEPDVLLRLEDEPDVAVLASLRALSADATFSIRSWCVSLVDA